MTASDIDRLATAHVALTNRLLSDSYWYEDFMTGVASLLALAAQSFAAVAVEQAEKLRRLENRDADADVLIATQKDIIAAEKARADGLQNRRDNLAHQFDNLVAQCRNLIESNKDLRRREEQERMLSGYANTELADMTVMWAEEKSRADEAEELLDTADDLLGRAIFAYGADENRYIAFLKRRSQEKP